MDGSRRGTAVSKYPAHSGYQRQVVQSVNSREIKLSGFANAARSSAERLQWLGDNGCRDWQQRAAPAPR